MQQNLKLGRVVQLGFGSVFAVMIVIGVVSKLTTDTLIDTNRWVNHTYQVEGSLDDITKLLLDAETGQRGFILTSRSDYLEPYNAAIRSFGTAFEETKRLIQDNPDQLKRLAAVKTLAEQKRENMTATITLTQQSKRNESLSMILSGEGKSLMDKIREQIAEMKQIEEELLTQRQASANQATALANWISLGGTLVAIAVGCGVLVFIAREVVQPINRVAGEIADSSNGIATTVEQQERTASQQSTSVTQTSATMNELSASSHQSAQQAENVANGARQILNLTDDGHQAVSQTLESIMTLSQKTMAVSDQILRLREQTSQIGSISGLVTDLANQTNMLALNAAVEAVRAGEQGKGFGVVAAEIRKLADQSKQSAEKINTLVIDIQVAINTTMTVANESTATAQQGAQITQETSTAFNKVVEAINDIVVNIQQISLNSTQQASAVQQVVQAMNALDAVAQDTATSIQQTRSTAHQLKDAVRKLQAVV